jgi:hypothetical protein
LEETVMPDRRSSKPTIHGLIDKQRKLAKSDQPVERATIALGATGALQERLPDLNDRQIGQLMFDIVWDELPLVSPAMTITTEATHRLFRSPGGASTGEQQFNAPDSLQCCPQCGEPMMRYFGIGEQDYQRCVALKCGYKKYVGVEPEKECL